MPKCTWDRVERTGSPHLARSAKIGSHLRLKAPKVVHSSKARTLIWRRHQRLQQDGWPMFHSVPEDSGAHISILRCGHSHCAQTRYLPRYGANASIAVCPASFGRIVHHPDTGNLHVKRAS